MFKLSKILYVVLLLVMSTTSYAGESPYICPMHPHIQGEQGSTCPICGMDLVEYKESKPIEEDAHSGHNMPNSVTIPSAMIQKIGVRTAEVKKHNFGGIVKAFGVIAANERLITEITSRADGWIEELSMSAVGDRVNKGDEIYKIHSPDLVTAQHDHIRSLKGKSALSSDYKLFEHYRIDRRIAEQLKETKKAIMDVPYYATASGVVSELNVHKGSYVTLNTVIAKLHDYSNVWVNVSVAEKDINRISKATKAKIIFPYDESKSIEAIVDYIHPTIDSDTRTGMVRLSVDNKDYALKPGSFVDVEFMTSQSERLSVPSEAILKDSQGSKVVVALGNGRFAPMNVTTGIRFKGQTEIVDGLSEGDEIVTSGQFLIDSESSLRESMSKLSSGGNMGGGHAGH